MLTAAEEKRLAAEKGKEQASAKVSEANKQIASVTRERDTAITQLKGMKEAEQRVQMLVTENGNLKQKLADAEKSVRELSADRPKKDKELVEVKTQIEQLRQQLAASQKQNKDYETKVADLRSQLDDVGAQ